MRPMSLGLVPFALAKVDDFVYKVLANLDEVVLGCCSMASTLPLQPQL